MKPEITIPLSLLLFFSSISHPANSQEFLSTLLTNSSEKSNGITVSTKRNNDKVIISTESNRTVVDIYSPFGISSANLSSVDSRWRKPLVLRLHLSGLESLRITIGNLTISTCINTSLTRCGTSFSINGKKPFRVKENDPFWIPIEIVNRQKPGHCGIPLKDGYFEVTIPEVLLKNNPGKLVVSWIDFYRI